MKTRIKLILRYDGTDYGGWQRQTKNTGKPTIQETLEDVLGKIFESKVRVAGSGRTDAGVHAEAQVAHFDAPRAVDNINIVQALNSMLPDSIAVLKSFAAPDEFHALFSATGKTYRYVIYNGPIRDPLQIRYATWIKKPLDIEILNQFSKVLIGEHDFKSFQTSGTEVKTTVRQISEAQWARGSGAHGGRLLEFRITGSGFLKQMVRNIVGTLLYLHQNRGTARDMKKILEFCDRRKAKMTAHPEGLHLHAVYYPPELDKACREL